MSITAIVPAVREPGISQTIRSLLAQEPAPDTVLVALNNSGDDPSTRQAAEAVGDSRIHVIDFGDCPGRKAEVLNRALEHTDGDLILVMDADTILAPGWIARALVDLERPEAGAVGAVFRADAGRGWLHDCQLREWVRYEEEIGRTGKTFVLSGTAALIRRTALDSLIEARGFAYNEDSITEDGEITVALKEQGWVLTSPVECLTTTETMPTVRDLVRQRTRWNLGAMQTVARHGLNRVSATYWRQQVMLALSVLLMGGFLTLTAVLTPIYGVHVTWLSVALLAAFTFERVVTVWDAGPRHRIIAALILPELAYALILQWSYVRAAGQFITRSRGQWSHV